MAHKRADFVLPVSIVTPHNISRLINETDGIESFFFQIKARRSGDGVTLPRIS